MKNVLMFVLVLIQYYGHSQLRHDICDKIIIGDFKCLNCTSALETLPKNMRTAVGTDLNYYSFCRVINRDRLGDILKRKDKEKLIAEINDLSIEEKQTLTAITQAQRVIFGEMEIQPADKSLLVTLVINNLETGVQETSNIFEIPFGQYDTYTKREPFVTKGIKEILFGKDGVNIPSATDGSAAETQDLPLKPTASQEDVMAYKGEKIAKQDPLAISLRNREPEGPSRRGFDIGMAATEGHTLPGPGKDKLCASLTQAEQLGFKSAMNFSLERNRNLEFATIGAAIAKASPVIAAARNRSQSEYFKLGFDIATGIFGDPALGARGNTATGPGSLGIRDALSDEGRKGFNAAVQLLLGPPALPRKG
ncbi:MAG: hypothetical protein ACKVT2_12410 [Saprospiraceae bacterium]